MNAPLEQPVRSAQVDRRTAETDISVRLAIHAAAAVSGPHRVGIEHPGLAGEGSVEQPGGVAQGEEPLALGRVGDVDGVGAHQLGGVAQGGGGSRCRFG